MEHVILQATEPFVLRGYGQLNKGEKALFSTEQALALMAEFPEGFIEIRQEDAVFKKAPVAPTVDKMQKAPERRK